MTKSLDLGKCQARQSQTWRLTRMPQGGLLRSTSIPRCLHSFSEPFKLTSFKVYHLVNLISFLVLLRAVDVQVPFESHHLMLDEGGRYATYDKRKLT